MSSNLVRGTFILTLGTFISKFLGLFYVIPFTMIVGTYGTALYNYGYIPYTIILSVATAGFPLAISKFVAKYNAIEEYAVGRKLFKSGLLVMLATGFLSFLFLYFSAPSIAEIVIPNDDLKSNPEDVTSVIRAVSFALIIIPFMSLIRGFFQGNQSMGPSAVSMVVEQIVRIGFLLAGAFAAINIFNGTIVSAVNVATFAAFIGGLGSIFVLGWYWTKRKHFFDEQLIRDRGTVQVSYKEIYKEVIAYAVPFTILAIANPLHQLVDQFTFNSAMASIGKADIAEIAFSVLSFQTFKLIVIPLALSNAFTLTLVPSITKAFFEQDGRSLHRQLNQAMQVLLFLTIPATIGLMVLAEPLYTLFYGYEEGINELGTIVLTVYAPVTILFAVFGVTSAILQGINQQKVMVLSILIGLLIKLVLNVPFIQMFETNGAVYSTAIGYFVSNLINFIVIKRNLNYQFRFIFRRTLLILILNIVMLLFVYMSYQALTLIFSTKTFIGSFMIVIVSGAIGVLIYFYLGVKTRLAILLLGKKVETIAKKLRWLK